MNIDEAYKILNVAKTATDDDIKKQFKKLAKQYHPDINKNEPEKFKQINQANDLIKDYRANPQKYNNQFSGININDIFSGFSNHFRQSGVHRTPTHVNTQVNLSFKEAVMGCDKDISYTRNMKCIECNGEGAIYKANGCNICDGFGKVIKTKGNMNFMQSCNKCYGKNVENKTCTLCNGSGTQFEDIKGNISIAAGRHSGDVLRMQGKGNFVEINIFGEQYTDVYVHIIVEKQDGLELINNDVVSKLDISLDEAFSGCEKTVLTIDGEKLIQINKMAHHKDEVIIPNLGVKNTDGNHKVILSIKYPNEQIVNSITKLLKEMKCQ